MKALSVFEALGGRKAVRAAAALAALAVFALPVQSQDSTSQPPRLANGKPDLNGIWQALGSANWDIEMHLARPALALQKGPHGPVPAPNVMAMGAVGAVPGGLGVVEGGKIPYKPEALAKKQENQEHWIERDPEIKCYLPGVPRATYMPYPFQIFQSESSILIAYEYAGAVRDVFLQDPGPAPVDSWMGQSYGKWEGDTLVVDVTGLLDSTWFDRSGNHHSDQLHVVERYTLKGANHIQYEATIEDTVTFEKPWKISMPLYRRIEPNAQLMDFRCVEFVEELLYGGWRKNPLPRPPEPLAKPQ
ncbi:MAG: hypothetical protein E4G90_08515 [Gemmatimonadales bacterium]|nr:MAG: hypothetical protein E4G90_08515 [Gemmatimonadales bacterium]